MKPIITLAKNQYSIETDGKITFQSYDTIVCEITNFENGNEPVIKIFDEPYEDPYNFEVTAVGSSKE